MFSTKKKTQLSSRPIISSPSNFVHQVHTGHDRDDGHLTGIPIQWASLLGDTQEAGAGQISGGIPSNGQISRGSTIGRPQPFVDPSLITDSQIKPLKVTYLCMSDLTELLSISCIYVLYFKHKISYVSFYFSKYFLILE